jgi:hypothetical protein
MCMNLPKRFNDSEGRYVLCVSSFLCELLHFFYNSALAALQTEERGTFQANLAHFVKKVPLFPRLSPKRFDDDSDGRI